MKDADIKALVEALGLKIKGQPSGNYAACNCPFGPWRHPGGKSNPHAFGLERGAGKHATCWSCGWSSDVDWMVDFLYNKERMSPSGIERDWKTAFHLVSWVKKEDPLLDVDGPSLDEMVLEPPKVLVPFPEQLCSGLEPAYCDGQVHPYLATRGVDYETAEFLDLRYDVWRKRVVFPTRGFDGVLYGLHGRDVTGTSDLPYLAYKADGQSNDQVWLGEHWLDDTKPVLLVESVFDLAACLPFFKNVATPRHSSISKAALERIAGFPAYYTLFDNDKAGNLARAKVASMKGAIVTHLTCAPYNDPGATPVDVLSEILAQIQTGKSLFS
jgi:hypothetical protein